MTASGTPPSLSTDALADLPLASAAGLIAAGRLTSEDLVADSLARIGRDDGALQSFVHLSATALEEARAADAARARGVPLGPLHGVPVAIKDNYTTAGQPTRAGSAVPGLDFPQVDSQCAARLRAAGAILIGKTRMHEFAWGMVTPPTANPWDRARVPGGSSGGSGAAVAARFCRAALGSDTGGSIRIPAALCGTVGLKPTYGRIGRSGIVPHSWSLDHAGPLTRNVEDAALMLQVLAGHDPADPASSTAPVPDYMAELAEPLAGLRVAVVRGHFFEAIDEEVADAVEAAFGFFGANGAQIREARAPALQYGLGAIFAIELASSTAYHDRRLARGETAQFTPDVRDLVEMGRLVSGPDYLKAEQMRARIMQDFADILSEADIILTPTSPITAWRKDEETVRLGGRDESVLAASWRLTYPFNLAGLPALSLPCGFDRRGLPIGLQIAARPFAEAMVLRAALAYERAHGWADARPPL